MDVYTLLIGINASESKRVLEEKKKKKKKEKKLNK
jgi:hypothetical protein